MHHPIVRLALLLLLAASTIAQSGGGEDDRRRTESWPLGTPRRTWSVDEQGLEHGKLEEFTEGGVRTLLATYSHGELHGEHRTWTELGDKLRFQNFQRGQLHGQFEEFHDNGRRAVLGRYREGLRDGKWTEVSRDGARKRTSTYRQGLLNGELRITVDGDTLTRQLWRDGLLLRLDDIEAPFPIAAAALRAELTAILETAPPAPDPADERAAERFAALLRLRAYRRLCGVPFADLCLEPAWNEKCDAAAAVCRALGHLDHTPVRPPGIDEALYELGAEGARRSNLARGTSLAGSVDSYMDDSDPTNIDRIGHRRWCLNPVMGRTGFGSDADFHAMWSMDGSGRAPKGLEHVLYPPAGFVPIDLFGPRHAWSVALLRGKNVDRDDLRVSIRPLDDDFLPAGEPLELDHLGVAGGGYGGGPCLVFRPRGLSTMIGRRYLCEVSCDRGASLALRYVVEFCAPVLERRR